jgi:hypothetical protein
MAEKEKETVYFPSVERPCYITVKLGNRIIYLTSEGDTSLQNMTSDTKPLLAFFEENKRRRTQNQNK